MAKKGVCSLLAPWDITLPLVDHVPKSSATIETLKISPDRIHRLCSMAFPSLQEEKNNVSSLVEAVLDEESDAEDEMEVSFTKVSPVGQQNTAP